MNDEIFSLMRQKAADAKSDDPLEVAEFYKVIPIKLKGTITGYATAYRTLAAIGYNTRLKDIWLLFVLWHELEHVFSDDIHDPAIGDKIVDNGIFTYEVDSFYIPRHEKRANLVSADMTVPDDDVLDLINYNSSSMQTYRRLKKYQGSLIQDFNNLKMSTDFSSASTKLKVKIQDLKRQINDVSDSLLEIEYDLMSMNGFMSFDEMAGNLGINDRILRYKLEAMRIRGFDIDRQELEDYSKMFSGALSS